MPIYEYECLKCGRTIEAMQKFSDAQLSECAECGGRLRKLISNTSFVLKGTGWYKTDYAGKGSGSGSEGKKSSAGKEAKSSTDTKSDAKSETKADGSQEVKPEAKKEPASTS